MHFRPHLARNLTPDWVSILPDKQDAEFAATSLIRGGPEKKQNDMRKPTSTSAMDHTKAQIPNIERHTQGPGSRRDRSRKPALRAPATSRSHRAGEGVRRSQDGIHCTRSAESRATAACRRDSGIGNRARKRHQRGCPRLCRATARRRATPGPNAGTR